MDNQDVNMNIFINNVQEDLSEAWSIIGELEKIRIVHNGTRSKNVEEDNYYEAYLESILEKIYLKLYFALEKLSLTHMLKQFQTGFKKFYPNINKLEVIPYVLTFDCPALDYLKKYFLAVKSLYINTDENNYNKEKRAKLKSILLNTDRIILDRDLKPQKESIVQKEVYNVLKYVFPDITREVPIAKETKTYKPDFGIRSLKTAIEYKFADSEAEVKNSIGGIYEDVNGYGGTEDWKYFYAVIYMTSKYYTKEQIESEFYNTNVPRNWEILLVAGPGDRAK